MNDHDHPHGHPDPAAQPPGGVPAAPEDAGSEALAAALRSSFAIVKVVMVVLVALFLVSGVFTVGPQEKVIVLRLGRPVGEGSKALLGAGLHWSFPPPIDELVKVPVTELQKVTSTVGWYYTTPEQEFSNQEPPAGPSLNPAVDGYTITGDGNIIHVRATITYRIEDPIRFAFDFVSASNAVQNDLDNTIVSVSAQYKVDDALTRDRAGFQERIQARVAELAREHQLGIVVEQCQVDARPPRFLKPQFDAVLTAVSRRETTHNEAQQYEKQVLTRAEADGASLTNTAQAERVRLVGAVQAEAEVLTNLAPSFRKNPDLFTSILLSQRMARVLTNAQEKFYVPEDVGGEKSELRIQLSREPLEPPAPKPAAR